IRKRIGDIAQRRLRRQPPDILERQQIGDGFERSIERRDADIPDVVARPRWQARAKSPKLHGVVVVTAASSNHAGPLRYMLESLRRLRARVECYDLGLTAAEVRALPRWAEFLYHKFDYARYPAHLDVEVNAGEYAWKPVIVAEVIDRLRAAGESEDVL